MFSGLSLVDGEVLLGLICALKRAVEIRPDFVSRGVAKSVSMTVMGVIRIELDSAYSVGVGIIPICLLRESSVTYRILGILWHDWSWGSVNRDLKGSAHHESNYDSSAPDCPI